MYCEGVSLIKPTCPNCGSKDVSIKNVVENIGDNIIEDYGVDYCYECGYPGSFDDDYDE